MFEVLHETALTPEPDAIIRDILREAIPQPFEHMITKQGKPQSADDTETLRTPTGNLQSGVSTLENTTGEPTTIRYFDDRALGLLANVYNKLTRGFYDNPDSPSEFVAPVRYRTPQQLLVATRELLAVLGHSDSSLTDERLLSMIESRKGSEEKFVYQGVAGTEGENAPYATEPLPPSEIIKQIKKLDKRIITLFGFSYLGYENPNAVMADIANLLQGFDPETDAINIGATQEGIGRAYEIAKKLGFTTLGIVSTLALSYSGRFSDAVDRIYIVNDERWGGYDPRTGELAGTTRAFLEVSDEIHAFGGGDNTTVALEEARKRGTVVTYTPAEMNHAIAEKDTAHSQHVAGRYGGSAYAAWQRISNTA
jgi:hypothetical protein